MVIWLTLIIVSALIGLPCATAQTITTSNRTSGVECGGDTPVAKCVQRATCSTDGDCQCPTDTYGDGAYQCHDNDKSRSQISGNSNTLLTLANTSADLVWPCRARFAEIKTSRLSDGNTCHFQVFALNKVIGGRVMAAGMEVHFRVEGDPKIPDGFAIRKEGIADHGLFTFKEWGRDTFELESALSDSDSNFTPDDSTDFDGSGSGDFGFLNPVQDDEDDDGWGAPEQLDIGAGTVVKAVVDDDNFAVVDVEDCGLKMKFRPPDEMGDLQHQKPGIAISIDGIHNPQFPNPETYLIESPTSNTLSNQAFQHGHSTSLEALHRSMMQSAKQPRTSAGEECEDTSRTYRGKCTSASDRLQALTSCSFFLQQRQLVDCMETETDGTGYRSLNAFKLCLWNTCSPSSAVCSLLKERVEERGCMPFTPDFFQSMTCTV